MRRDEQLKQLTPELRTPGEVQRANAKSALQTGLSAPDGILRQAAQSQYDQAISAMDEAAALIPSVGGHIDLTTLDQRGSRTERLLTRPDRRLKIMDTALKPTILLRGAPKRNTAIVTAPPPFISPERIKPLPVTELAA